MEESGTMLHAGLSLAFFAPILIVLFHRHLSSSKDIRKLESFNDCLEVEIDENAVTKFSHQVAGHMCEALKKYDNYVLKPMVKLNLFSREVKLYEDLRRAGDHCTQSLKRFVPKYYGIAFLNSTKSVTIPHIVLEDLTAGYSFPCCLDLKMGTQTYEPEATEDKKTREKKKYSYQSTIGFRITGFKVYDIQRKGYLWVDKWFGRSLKPFQVKDALSLFFFNGQYFRRDVILATICQLEKLLLWMKGQVNLNFYCSSILVVYDGFVGQEGVNCSKNCSKDLVTVRIVDLAHTLSTKNQELSSQKIDEGYIVGLVHLIEYLHQIVQDIDFNTIYDRSQEQHFHSFLSFTKQNP